MKPTLILIIALSIYSVSLGSSLERRGQLGVQLEPISMDAGKAIIKEVFPNGTAYNIGVEKNDTIVSINSIEFEDFNSFLNGLSQSKKEKRIKVSVKRGKKTMELKGELVDLPFTVKNKYELNSFDFENSQIRTIIEKPQGEGPFPVLYYIQGYPCQSCEYTNPNSSIRKFIDDMVSYGYLVYRVEKPNMGDSKGNLECSEIDFDTENAVFAKGYDELLNRNDVDKEKITLFGHSMGGWHAPIIANMKSPLATVVYGIRIEDWYDYFLYAVEYQHPFRNYSARRV
jgi:dipeptidyl aminopeptidase/acylaminoacyl peptidase